MNTAVALDFPPTVSPAPARVPVRHMDFHFDPSKADDRFYLKAELASAYFEALSIFLTYGEDLVIDTARHHRGLLTDPVLKQRVTALIGQEAIHSRVHNEWNDVLAKHKFPVPLYRFLGGKVFEYGFNRFPQPLKLSKTMKISSKFLMLVLPLHLISQRPHCEFSRLCWRSTGK